MVTASAAFRVAAGPSPASRWVVAVRDGSGGSDGWSIDPEKRPLGIRVPVRARELEATLQLELLVALDRRRLVQRACGRLQATVEPIEASDLEPCEVLDLAVGGQQRSQPLDRGVSRLAVRERRAADSVGGGPGRCPNRRGRDQRRDAGLPVRAPAQSCRPSAEKLRAGADFGPDPMATSSAPAAAYARPTPNSPSRSSAAVRASASSATLPGGVAVAAGGEGQAEVSPGDGPVWIDGHGETEGPVWPRRAPVRARRGRGSSASVPW